MPLIKGVIMKSPTRAVAVLALVMAASGIAASAPVLADGYRGQVRIGVRAGGPVLAHGRGLGHGGLVRFGVFVAAPVVMWRSFYGPPPYYYSSPYYPPYYPPVVAVPVSQPTYVEQGQVGAAPPSAAPAAPEPGYWYYCADSRAYYPYVKECPGGWQRVSPQPPPG